MDYRSRRCVFPYNLSDQIMVINLPFPIYSPQTPLSRLRPELGRSSNNRHRRNTLAPCPPGLVLNANFFHIAVKFIDEKYLQGKVGDNWAHDFLFLVSLTQPHRKS
jgi:hypothetical protein